MAPSQQLPLDASAPPAVRSSGVRLRRRPAPLAAHRLGAASGEPRLGRPSAVLDRPAESGSGAILRVGPKTRKMAIRSHTLAPAAAEETYQHLERRPDSWRRQLFIKGRGLAVGQLVRNMMANGHTAESAAEDYDLTVDQINEALRYYERHKDVIQHDEEEERAYLRSVGIVVGSPSSRR